MRRFSQFVGLAVLVGCSESGGPGGKSGEAGTGGDSAGSGAKNGASGAMSAGGASAGRSNAGGAAAARPSTGGSDAGRSSTGGSDAGRSSSDAGRSSSDAGRSSSDAGRSSMGGSDARPPGDATCDLPNAAFCDTFTKPSPGGRAGDLDDANWSFARLGFGCEGSFSFPPTPLNLCGVWQTVKPGGPDSQFCTDENDEPRWAEGFDDNSSFNYIAARIRQPFDFEGRTGTIQWQADARTSGSHGWWVETWITEEPVPGVNVHIDQVVTPKEAVGIELSLNCGAPAAGLGTAGSGKVGVNRIIVVHDYEITDAYDPFTGPSANARCVRTEQGVLNEFQFKLSKNRVEVWATDAGGTMLQRIAEADVDLPFTRGYVNISHVHYNAHKAEVTSYQSYQWARVAFDGPELRAPRAYEILDPLSDSVGTAACAPNGYRIAYGINDGVAYDLGAGPEKPIALTFEGVNPEGGTSARLNFNTTFVRAGDTLRFRFNGKSWHDFVVPAIRSTWERQGFSVPLPVTDLASGANTLEIATNTSSFALPPNSMHVANIDLEIELP